MRVLLPHISRGITFRFERSRADSDEVASDRQVSSAKRLGDRGSVRAQAAIEGLDQQPGNRLTV
jgi:hypothetical protein